MHRRGVGAGAIAKKKLAEAKYKERGTVLAEDNLKKKKKRIKERKEMKQRVQKDGEEGKVDRGKIQKEISSSL